ncbi:MAG: hypothetical protein COZ86_02685 [Candidatus Moranbacteria bacterium CG_4_8_14_3_um_filter_41_13]|nr:MAG: hypothetical protein AUK58_00610 [Candidatus Moranbacteria bacterium CG2_30_41_165]PIW94127.1 MAG: hypothetical protein COZ86_02685 [Candidatus Moranbacteria bacterium CG_4_8_14_3_um_filter_41_13]
MPEKKEVHHKKESSETSIPGLLLDGVMKSVQSFIDEALQSVHKRVDIFFGKVAKKVFLFGLGFFGMLFLFVGLAKILSVLVGVPGAGETLMGLMMLVIVFIVYTFERK